MVIGVVAMLAFAMVGFQALRALGQAQDRGSGPYRDQTLQTAAWLDCISRRLAVVLPADATVYFDPAFGTLNGGLITQRLSELAFPRFRQVAAREQADFVLTAEVVEREGACSSVFVDAAPIR